MPSFLGWDLQEGDHGCSPEDHARAEGHVRWVRSRGHGERAGMFGSMSAPFMRNLGRLQGLKVKQSTYRHQESPRCYGGGFERWRVWAGFKHTVNDKVSESFSKHE